MVEVNARELRHVLAFVEKMPRHARAGDAAAEAALGDCGIMAHTLALAAHPARARAPNPPNKQPWVRTPGSVLVLTSCGT